MVSPTLTVSALLFFLLSFLNFDLTSAVTTIHFYKNPSCNTGTDMGTYDAPTTPTASNTSCNDIHNHTQALYINGLDDGCAVLTFTAPSCPTKNQQSKLAVKGECYFLDDFGVIGSWKAVCGSNLTTLESNGASAGGGSSGNASAVVSGSSGSSTAGVASSTASSATSESSATANSGTKMVYLGSGGSFAVSTMGLALISWLLV